LFKKNPVPSGTMPLPKKWLIVWVTETILPSLSAAENVVVEKCSSYSVSEKAVF